MSIRQLYNYRVLVIGPSAEWGALDRILVDDGYQVEAVDSVLDAEQILTSDPPSLILVGLELSARTLDRLRRDTCVRDLPVIVVCDSTCSDAAFAALDEGASDVISAPLRGAELLARVRLQLRNSRRIVELQRASILDELTGVRNRRGIMEVLSSELKRAKRNQAPLSLALIDVNAFKYINDTFGHNAGDEVLARLAVALEGALRQSDMVGRLGGDEFVVVLPETDAQNSSQVIARIQEAVSTLRVPRTQHAVSIAVGISGCHDGSASAAELLKAADIAMYADKTGHQPLALSA